MAVTRGALHRLMILVPPGSAKSTYASVLFPPWYLANKPGCSILACSYSATLAVRFGKRCRNLIDNQSTILGYKLKADSKAADDWETSNGGLYFCAGVGAGIAGHRADLGLIDDPIGSQEDADSDTIREKQWDWWLNDYIPRLKPQAAQIIICNRRHEDDLPGRILAAEGDKWTVVRLPMVAEADDPLGRSPGARLWPEWYTDEMVETARRVPRVWAGLYQQRPSPEEGDYFHKKWLVGYEPQDLPPLSELRVYGAGDFAVSEELNANRSCFGFCGIDKDDVMWLLPDLFWDKADTNVMVNQIIRLCRQYKPITFWAEKGHISKSIWPFLRKRMFETKTYINLEEVVPSRAKDVRARPLQGRLAMGMIRVPKFAPWWADAEHELLMAFNGRDDDFVDMFAHLGAGVDKMVAASGAPPVEETILTGDFQPTFKWLKESDRYVRQRKQVALLDN